MAHPNGHGGWDITDDEAREVIERSGGTLDEDDKVYSFLYRLLLHGKPVEGLDASRWRLHVVTDLEERDSLMHHYEGMFFASEPNKSWQIVPVELPK